MPSNQSPLGALPARFRRMRVLIVGCGDVGMRAARQLNAGSARVSVSALTTSAERSPQLRAAGVRPLLGNLDDKASLARLAGVFQRVLYLAPPPGEGETGAQWWRDVRSENLNRVLRLRALPDALVYASTTGVYGDCDGAWVNETRTVAPATPRAQRRVNAERAMRHLGRAGVRVSILRVPGIYGLDRPSGTPVARLQRGTPVLKERDDVYTNHIQADDLAGACLAALWRGKAQRVYNVRDDTDMRMGDYFDMAADLFGLPRPPRVARDAAKDQLPVTLLSFMSESRRLEARRMHEELRVRLRYPTVMQGLRGEPVRR
ncbi:SDR family NAD(P)-dependent oxidoreductase [Diaphorobacter sp. HDW4B]|uniref:NAD-dependent epimerase/dehydratase family protein n=1 Tax=Diaphorobacter sp. HDW4B TaxID=2714925 RepID=UPI00140731CA|nr:NAD-dependent epimerase/dehydratase family protein [Diaphorobacter sp. HDW4B]QIL72198.1 SDR family NAD(P)-dependent oxidoreductase [Diaphorobacter sp. HDW4B]